MIKQKIRLTKPYSFVPVFEIEPPQSGKVLVRPTVMSICAADQRYFTGNRPKEVLAKKLPMSLIHEAIGIVISDDTGTFKPNQHVILLPGGEEHGDKESNYVKNAFFRSSNADGFCQEMLYLSPEELIAIPEKGAEYYVFAELMSVCCHALRRIAERGMLKLKDRKVRIGIWGDGAMGYMMALVAKECYPDNPITVFGKHDNKLMLFSFADRKVNIIYEAELPEIDVAFECVGGQGSVDAIEQIITALRPCGAATLMGVSEIPPAINTRMILEKGLLFQGSSRSQRRDFEQAKELIDRSHVHGSLEKIISEHVVIKNHMDLFDAFMSDRKNPFRTVLKMSL